MAPKKAIVEAKVSAVPSESEMAEENTGVSEEQGKKEPRKAPTHPTTLVMVKEALKELDSRKGVSAQAIRTFIREKHPTVDESRVKFMVRKALVKGLELGTFIRPANSNTTGAQGRFRLAVRKEPKPTKTKEVKENTNPNVGKAKAKEAGKVKTKAVKKASPAPDGIKPKKTKTDATASKVAPAKKPKSKQGPGKESSESKAQTSKSEGEAPEKPTVKKGGKRGAQKADEGGNKGAQAAVPKKGKKAAQKTEGGGKKAALMASDGEEAPKAVGRKGKKVVVK